MKLKSFYIAISSLVLLISLACIVIEYLKLRKTRRFNWEAKRSTWESDLISSRLVEDDADRIQDLDFRKTVNVIDMKVKQIQIFGRIKADDDLKLQRDVIEIQDKREEMTISNDLGKNDDSTNEGTFAESTTTKDNQNYIRGETKKDYISYKRRLGIFNISRNITGKRAQPGQHLIKKTKIHLGAGFLNLYIWDKICNYNLESLKGNILFPSLPTVQEAINKTEFCNLTVKNSGVRIFGFLKPKITGMYRFGIASSGNSELWLSNDTNIFNRRRIAFIGSENERGLVKEDVYDQVHTQRSEELLLSRGNYYFIEILYKHTKGRGRVQVAWKTPLTSMFEVIQGSYLSTSPNDSHVTEGVAEHEDYDGINVQMSSNGLHKMTFMDFIDFENAFPFCDYEPSYYIKKKLVRFQGARNKSNTHFVEVYPSDNTNITLPLVEGEDIWWTENNYGNDVIDDATVEHVSKMFTKAMEKTYKEDFKVVKMLSLERVVDKVKGSRYHVQMEIEDIYSGSHHEFSEFLYQPKGLGSLCFPRDFRWNKHADVNIIVPVKNSGRWAFYLVKNLEAIISKTLDPHIHLIIIDYSSTDIDIEAVLKRTSIIRHTVVRMPVDKEFNRAEALQRGADVVKDPNSILFMCDLHLTMPVILIETIRKHCVQGKMAFAPVVKRLKCGYHPKKPIGYWETLGFGLFALYKSDFDRVGGMNVKHFKQWGGEDWELLDRVLESRMEVERLKIPSFFHYFHPPYGRGNSRVGAK